MPTPVPIDLESTGLDPSKDAILEFAMLLVTPDLETIADFGSRVVHATEEQLALMDDYVRDMHTKTGLLDDVRASTLALDDLDREAATWLAQHGLVEKNSGIILGSSCLLDLNFIEHQMPLLAEVLHYRMIDISGLRETLLMWEPELVPGPPFQVAMQDDWIAHRAGSDIRWSLEEARDLRSSIKLGAAF